MGPMNTQGMVETKPESRIEIPSLPSTQLVPHRPASRAVADERTTIVARSRT